MRGDVVYRIYGVHADREKDYFFGAFRTVAEAEAEIAKLRLREMNGVELGRTISQPRTIRETVRQTRTSKIRRARSPATATSPCGARGKEYGAGTIAGTAVRGLPTHQRQGRTGKGV